MPPTVITLAAPVRGEPTPAQRAIGAGDCVISTPGPQWPAIYGRVWTREEFAAVHRADIALEDFEAWYRPVALEWRLLVHEHRYQLGYVYGTFYSVAEEDGEDGESHVSTCRRISAAEFAAARERGWR